MELGLSIQVLKKRRIAHVIKQRGMNVSTHHDLQTAQFTCSREFFPLFYSRSGETTTVAFSSISAFFFYRYGGLGNRLRAVASALTVAREFNANVVIVWTDKEHGFRGQWDELFASPRIPLGCFPGNVVRENHAKCTVHKVNHFTEWEAVKNNFERVDGHEILCMQSMMFLSRKQRGIGWFYSLLRPTAPIAKAIAAFQRNVGWQNWGQWIGVHIRRTDLRLRCNSDDCSDGLSATEVLPLTTYIDILDQIAAMGEISGDKPRFFLATDDAKTEETVRSALLRSANMTGTLSSRQAEEMVVSYSKAIRDTTQNALAMRSSTAGTAEAVVDLWLLSRTRMLVGTVGSSYSQTAKMMGGPFFISVGVEFENRL